MSRVGCGQVLGLLILLGWLAVPPLPAIRGRAVQHYPPNPSRGPSFLATGIDGVTCLDNSRFLS